MSDLINDNLKIEEQELEQAALEVLETAKTPGWKRIEKVIQDNIAVIDAILRGQGNEIKDIHELRRYQDQREHLESLLNLPSEFAKHLKKTEAPEDDPYS